MPTYTLPQAPVAPQPGANKPTSTGWYASPFATSVSASGRAPASQLGGIDRNGAQINLGSQAPIQSPGNNFTNPGYTEQGFEYIQNRLLNDPAQGYLQNAANSLSNPTAGENWLNQNLGTLNGPGSGDQYWNQVSGQFQSPFAGEQFARLATQNFNAQGPASAFYNQSMGDYGRLTNYSGPQNAQGQYGQSSAELAGGTAGEQGLGQLAGQYGNIGQYQGGNNALGQYQSNAAYGPMAAQSFYDQVGGQYGQLGQYSDPNLAAQQYAATQQSFGALPTADSADPYYDRAVQLGTQSYNRQAAGRGVYGSSEALSGVGNMVADLNAQRAQNQFGNEMAIAQENRARQELLGNQARMGDLSGQGAFGLNLQGLQTFGNLANQAGNQTLAQQTMLGNQARSADQTGLDAFNANLQGVNTFANVNNMLGNQQLQRNELLGNMANQADSQALGAQNANIAGMNAFGNIAQAADAAETNRYQATTNAMNQADRTGLDRLSTGANIAFESDANRRNNFTAQAGAAAQAAGLGMDRTRLGADIMNTASQNDMSRLNNFMGAAGQAEGDRQARQAATVAATQGYSQQVQNAISSALQNFQGGSQADWENVVQTQIAPALQAMGYDQQQIAQLTSTLNSAIGAIGKKQ